MTIWDPGAVVGAEGSMQKVDMRNVGLSTHGVDVANVLVNVDLEATLLGRSNGGYDLFKVFLDLFWRATNPPSALCPFVIQCIQHFIAL